MSSGDIQIIDAIGPLPGDKIAEVGAGDGRYVMHAARRVGDTGKVYAEDIDSEALQKCLIRCEREDIRNVEIILGTQNNPHLPNNELDLVYVVNTYFLFKNPVKLLQNIKPSLKMDGTLVIAECADVTPMDEIIEKAGLAGYELDKIISIAYEKFNICHFKIL